MIMLVILLIPPIPNKAYALRACLGNGEFKWMEEDLRGFWEILTYSGNSSTPMPFIPVHSTDSQTSPKRSCPGDYFICSTWRDVLDTILHHDTWERLVP
jgi:hypothetical protein